MTRPQADVVPASRFVIPPFVAALDRLSPTSAMVLSCIVGAIIFSIDWLCSPLVPFGPYYLIPVACAAWSSPAFFAYFLVVALSIARTVVLSRQFTEHLVLYYVADVVSFMFIYAGAAYLLRHLKRAYLELSDETRALSSKVEQARRRTWLDASIRRAVLADVDRIVQLAALGGEDGDLSEDLVTAERQASLRNAYAESIQHGAGARKTWAGQREIVPIEFWVSQINDQIAGFFMVVALDDKQGPERELHAIVTANEYRGVGVASAMVEFFCSHYYGRKLYAAVMPGSRMHQMLKRRGFFHHADSLEGYCVLERTEWPREKGLLHDRTSDELAAEHPDSWSAH